MQTTGYSAEYGRLAGGTMNMALKSGTNRLHGTLFEFVRNDAFDARGFFDPEKTKLRRNQFGAVLDGPVYIPKALQRPRSHLLPVQLGGLPAGERHFQHRHACPRWRSARAISTARWM